MKTLAYWLSVKLARLGKALGKHCPALGANLQAAGWRIYSKL